MGRLGWEGQSIKGDTVYEQLDNNFHLCFSFGYKIIWIDQQKKFKELPEIKHSIPSTLQTELRNYQTDRFNWLFRLAHWGVGACLADDRGLGKTIQALALILTQCHLGPIFIVAPSSVCINWLEETKRFAPTLNAIAFGEFGAKDLKKNIENFSSFDMLIC